MQRIRVAVIDEHEIFRRGLVTSLGDDPVLTVVAEASAGPAPAETDVVVASAAAAVLETFACPVVLCVPDPKKASSGFGPNRVLAVLARDTLTPEQLTGAVRAAAAGLQVNEPGPPAMPGRLDGRRLEVLRMLAGGAHTHEISKELNYSERTIKGLISEIERELGARNRAQAVAEGIRLGLI